MPIATAEGPTHRLTRRSSARTVLRTVYEVGPVSRADVSRATGLTRTTVSDVVDGFLAQGLMREVGTGPSTGGKAPILLEVPSDARHLLGIDVDRDGLSGIVINLRGEVRARAERDLAGHDGEAALEELDDLVIELTHEARQPLVGIGVGTPGLVDIDSGMVRWAVGLEWRDVPLGVRLSELTHLPVVVVNDSQAAAMAEWAFGGHDTSSVMVVVKVGEGIGAGIVMRGRLYPGDDSGAGEIGHARVSQADERCRCGSQGCLETVASLRAVLTRLGQLVPDHPGSLLAGRTITRESALEAFRAGDPLVRQVVLESALPLGRVLGTMICTLGAREVVLVGAMTDYGEPWLEGVRAEISRSAFRLLAERSTIHLGTTGPDVVELGAAAMLMTSELGLALAA
jgi:predicted NBD/HSP70 family sugar kinase